MSAYIMESKAEAQRLVAQERALSVDPLLELTGLKAGMRALDAGCGPGMIAREIAERVGPSGQVTGIDLSATRLEQARQANASRPWCRFEEASITASGLPSGSFDYAWSQFVLEYLPDPAAAIAELKRVTRSGGRIVVSEIDGVGMQNWPWPQELSDGFDRLVRGAAKTGFDIHIGRKLFGMFRAAGLEDVKVHLFPMYVVAGAADDRLVTDWRVRFETLRPVAAPEFDSPAAYDAFASRYLDMLRDGASLKYSLLLLTEGRVP